MTRANAYVLAVALSGTSMPSVPLILLPPDPDHLVKLALLRDNSPQLQTDKLEWQSVFPNVNGI